MNRSRTPATVYDAATELVALSDDIIDLLLLRTVTLADELQRVAMSLPAAIADASSVSSVQTRLDLYRTALRAASECASLLDSCRCLAGAGVEAVHMGRDLICQIVAALNLLAAGCDSDAERLPVRTAPRAGPTCGAGRAATEVGP